MFFFIFILLILILYIFVLSTLYDCFVLGHVYVVVNIANSYQNILLYEFFHLI